jgi:hypothetical protein
MAKQKLTQARWQCSCGKFYRRDRHYNLSICPWCFSDRALAEHGEVVPIFLGRKSGRYCRRCGAQFDAAIQQQARCQDCIDNQGVKFYDDLPEDVKSLADALESTDGIEFVEN